MDCYDCVHSNVKRGRLVCSRSDQVVEDRVSICSNFADSSSKTCDDCDYYEFGVFSRWNDHGRCKLTGKSRRDDDVVSTQLA